MAKKFAFKGLELEQLKKLSLEEFTKIAPAHARRTLKRMSPPLKKFLEKMRRAKAKNKPMKTHYRNAPVIPEMIGMHFKVYNGKEWVDVTIKPEMLGHKLGEFSIPIKLVKHHGPGIGATRGSKSVELK
ncbi:MAG: 30S ribosomal protein S19 [Candidatus Micrarchaeia archaeon]|jgi:small subunit ribosomal protein S19